MENVGTVISLEGSPSTYEFSFVINPKNKDGIKKGQFVQTESEEGLVFGYVREIVRANRYFERAESVAEYERSGTFSEHFPIDNWEHLVANTRILGTFKDNRFLRTSLPPYPGSKVNKGKDDMLKQFLGFQEKGLNLGNLQHHELNVKLGITKLLQKHLAILAMSGAGKSHLASVLLEELLVRDKESGRISIVIVDIHGEYIGFKFDGKYSRKVRIVEGKNIKIPFRSLSPSNIFEWFPELSHAGKSVINQVMNEMKKEMKAERKSYGLKDFFERLQTYPAKENVKDPIKRMVQELRGYRLISKKENPKIANDVKSGEMLILDLSDLDNMKKKRMIVAYIGKKLFNLRKKAKIPPFLFLVEEAHNFATEKMDKFSNISKPIVEKIAREGRKFGACLCLISQRPVNLSTTALSQCVTPDTEIELNPGNTKKIEELEGEWQNSKILSYDVTKKKMVSGSISNYIRRNPQEKDVKVFRVTTKETGKEIMATEDHPFWVKGEGWVPLKGISIGDKVATKSQQTSYGGNSREILLVSEKDIKQVLPDTIDQKRLISKLKELSFLPLTTKNKRIMALVRILGHLFGDGTLHPPYKNPEKQHSLRITFSGKEIELLEIQKDLKKLGFSGEQKISRDFRESICNFQKYGKKSIKGTSTYFKTGIVALWALLRLLGAPVGSKSKNKVRIPKWIMKAPLSIKREFLAAYLGSEAQKIRMEIKSAERIMIPFSKDEQLAKNAKDFRNEIVHLLSEFGVETTTYERDYSISNDGVKTIQYYINVGRSRKNIIKFCKNIGYRYSPERETQARLVLSYQEMLQKLLDKKIALWRKAKGINNAKKLSEKLGISIEDAKSLLRTKKMVKLSTKDILSFKDWKKRATIGLGDGLVWETVENKNVVEITDVRDISVPEYHAFFANGFLTHNCNTHIILRVTNPNDLKHISESSEGIDMRMLKSITSLNVGEGIIVGEAVKHPIFVEIRDRNSKKVEKGEPLDKQAKKYEESLEKKKKDVEAFL